MVDAKTRNPIRRCAVCGDTHQSNVKLVWRRYRDGLLFDICLRCAEIPNRVNENSVDNYGPSKTQEVL